MYSTLSRKTLSQFTICLVLLLYLPYTMPVSAFPIKIPPISLPDIDNYTLTVVLPIFLAYGIAAWTLLLATGSIIPNFIFIIEFTVTAFSASYLWINALKDQYNPIMVVGLFTYFIYSAYLLSVIIISYKRAGMRALISDEPNVYIALSREGFWISIIVIGVFIGHIYFWENRLTLKDKLFLGVFLIGAASTFGRKLHLYFQGFRNLPQPSQVAYFVLSFIFFCFLISKIEKDDDEKGKSLFIIFTAGFHQFVYVKYERVLLACVHPFILIMLLLY
ncbi:14073_t:CDS:1 [Acaulospora morrowiae]|uniref:14073_t:CDS:1 n=1 Tax=Acaulospora morrowiae TaxID=94023 RepID=A0A9N9DD85_9GLOM|nr:14073_t:CDS:1 [Acaulospora morrowiae]